MTIPDELSSALGRRDQGPNIRIATRIAREINYDLLEELAQLLISKPKAKLANDAVMVLMSLAERAPDMLVDRVEFLIPYLSSKNNQQVWGTMTILSNITHLVPKQIHQHLALILEVMDRGSVITRDRGFRILCHLYSQDEFRNDLSHLIIEQLYVAPPNQLGQYTERYMEVMIDQHKSTLKKVLELRLGELDDQHHRTRTIKNLKKL